jgi:hypothetical protein
MYQYCFQFWHRFCIPLAYNSNVNSIFYNFTDKEMTHAEMV